MGGGRAGEEGGRGKGGGGKRGGGERGRGKVSGGGGREPLGGEVDLCVCKTSQSYRMRPCLKAVK